MRHLNYNHLQYFWAVANEGTIARAAERLNVTPQTISGQLKLFEDAVGQSLFDRVGRGLLLTETGHVVLEYANEIFSVGAELANTIGSQRLTGAPVLGIGIVNSIPKLIAERIIAPTLVNGEEIRIRCQESSLEHLLGELAIHKLDIVLSDQPMPNGLSLRAFNHRLGESGLGFYAREKLARIYKAGFPQSLADAPMLLPSANSALRRRLDDWFESGGISPRIVGEFDDSALIKAFGEAGAGLFVAPSAIESEVCRMYGVDLVGSTDDVKESYYAISPERRIKHPAVARITEAARNELFPDHRTAGGS